MKSSQNDYIYIIIIFQIRNQEEIRDCDPAAEEEQKEQQQQQLLQRRSEAKRQPPEGARRLQRRPDQAPEDA